MAPHTPNRLSARASLPIPPTLDAWSTPQIGRALGPRTRVPLSIAIGLVFVPLYTALGFFVDPYLPGVVKGVFEGVYFFGALLTWVNMAFSVIFGVLFNGYVVLGTYSILVHSWRLTILAWLATAVIAAAVIGYMVAAGIG